MKYKDSNVPINERVDDLLFRMNLEEKAGQLCQVDLGEVDPDLWINKRHLGSCLHILGAELNKYQNMALKSRLGIPLLFGIDAIHGHGFWPGATIFPTQLSLASSWNPDLINKTASVTAKEVSATGAHWTFSPVLCLARDLRWGRIGETFGEDPFLIGVFGSAMIKGYQGNSISDEDKILACAKHFIGYSETQGGRDSSESDLSKRKLLSYFLPPFEDAVKAGCKTFMAGYQCIDGIPCSTNSWLLTDILRKKLKYEGFVVSDWKNINEMIERQFVYNNYLNASKSAVEAGNDMSMAVNEFYDAVIQSVKNGDLDITFVNESCRRILKIKFELGLFDGKKLFSDENKINNVIYTDDHKKLALESAYQSIVLLKNKNNILPLSENHNKISVIGENADNIKNQLGDWSTHSTDMIERRKNHPKNRVKTILDGINNRIGNKVKVEYIKGCSINSDLNNIDEAVESAKNSDINIVVLGDSLELTGEKKDRANLDLPGLQKRLFDEIYNTGKPVIVILINSKPLSIPVIYEKADAVLEAWNPGMEGGTAVAGILFGDRNPEGKLTISFPYHVGQQPVYYNQIPGWHVKKYVDMPENPLFSFGFGLSYTNYKYSNLKIKNSRLTINEDLKVSIHVENIGKRLGTEIVQLYINDIYTSVTTPVKILKGFKRIKLSPGEKKKVSFVVPYEELALINSSLEKVVEPGEFEIMIGASSRDEDLIMERFWVV